MKKILSFIVIVLSFMNVYAQGDIKCKIIDIQNGAALTDVHVFSLQDSSVLVSDQFGEISISKVGFYKLSKVSYEDKTVWVDHQVIYIQMSIKASELGEVVVNANQIPDNLHHSISSIHVVTKLDLERGDGVNVAPILNNVSGVYMHSGALNTNRITIRGVGARNLYGTAKIKAYFGDIPLTTGSGETNIEDFDLSSFARLEIIKGAGSSAYGAGLGGAIYLSPKKPYFDETIVGTHTTIGSYGLVKHVLSFDHGRKKNSIGVSYSNTHRDGYRENNEYDRKTLSLSSQHYISHKDALTILVSYVDLQAFIPSSINEETYKEEPESAAFTWRKSKGNEDSNRGIFGLSWKHDFSKNRKQMTSVFSSFRDAKEERPFNILDENTLAFGVRSRIIAEEKWLNKRLVWTLGGEWFQDIHQLKTFENLYKNGANDVGSIKGQNLSNFTEYRSHYNLFFEGNYQIIEKTKLTVGANLNRTFYTLKDDFVDINNPDQSGDYGFGMVFSPKVGISHSITESINVFGSMGHGFSPPSIEETLLPDGQINTEIEPEVGLTFELGSRGSVIHERLDFNLAIFRMNVRNLLVAKRVSEDQYIGVNAGKTRHDGLELELRCKVVDIKFIQINTSLSYSLNKFVFKEFVDDGEDYSGNSLTGVPSDVLSVVTDVKTKFGLYGNINYQYIGSMPMTDSNHLFSDAYKLINTKIGYRITIMKHLLWDVSVGMNNVFNEKYSSQILINAKSFGGKAPRYYYPGDPRNYYGCLSMKYVF